MKHRHHKVPKYMGGTDDPTNIVKLTIKEHAAEHKKLYKKYGNWQDKVAYIGLLKLVSKEELVAMILREGGKKGADMTNSIPKELRKNWPSGNNGNGWLKGNQNTAKDYVIETPKGKTIKIHGLTKWCQENGMNIKSFHKQVIERKKTHMGYKLADL